MEPEIIIGADFLKKVQPRIDAAKYTIDIVMFQWRVPATADDSPIYQLLNMMHAAITRGVKVRVVTDSQAVCALLKDWHFTVRVITTSKLLHAKMMLIDDVTLIVGSHNYTPSALSQNWEMSICVQLPRKENDAKLFFSNLFGI